MNEEYIYLKLVTGEQLMAYKADEDDTSVMIKYPMMIKTHLVAATHDRVSEQVTAGPYSLFVESDSLMINKNHIVLASCLHERAIKHYARLVLDHEGVELPYQRQELDWSECPVEGVESVEEVESIIDQLKAISDELDNKEKDVLGSLDVSKHTLH